MQKNAFSLVELSIVLAILGLLTGGILTGQTLIRAAELRAVSTEFQRYQSAVNTFRDKYFALPGDMRNAESFWGTVSVGTCPTGTGVGTETCNGDGDGLITYNGAPIREIYRFWQHLANAGLVEGSFTGVTGSGHSMRDANLAENVPRSKLSNAGWTALAINASGTQAPPTSARFDIEYGNTLMFGAPETSPDYETWKEVIIPEEAWNIDTKLDDGQPGTGSVIAMFWDNRCANAANNTDTSSQYRLTDTAVQCALVFRNAF